MRTWQLRPATIDDADQIARLHVMGWKQGYRSLLPDAYLDAIDEQAGIDRWRHGLANPSELQILVACGSDGRPVGFTSIGYCFDDDADGRWELWDLWVDAELRSQGIGAQLVAAALALAPPGVDVTVWVLAANTRAQRFYESTGAVRDNRARRSVDQGVEIRDLRWRWHRAASRKD